MSEKELQERLVKYMSKYFEVTDEVWDVNMKKRIDVVLVHKKDSKKKYPIGIEMKTNQKKKGRDIGMWLKQSSTYSECDFTNYGKVIVCTYPQVSGLYFEEGALMSKHNVTDSYFLSLHHNVNTFLGQFNIGELQEYTRDGDRYYRIVFNSTLIWDEYRDTFKIKNAKKAWER